MLPSYDLGEDRSEAEVTRKMAFEVLSSSVRVSRALAWARGATFIVLMVSGVSARFILRRQRSIRDATAMSGRGGGYRGWHSSMLISTAWLAAGGAAQAIPTRAYPLGADLLMAADGCYIA